MVSHSLDGFNVNKHREEKGAVWAQWLWKGKEGADENVYFLGRDMRIVCHLPYFPKTSAQVAVSRFQISSSQT